MIGHFVDFTSPPLDFGESGVICPRYNRFHFHGSAVDLEASNDGVTWQRMIGISASPTSVIQNVFGAIQDLYAYFAWWLNV